MPIFTSWGPKDAQSPCTLASGEDPPCFKDGTPEPDCEQLFWRIEAATWEEAMAIYHLRQGWEPYNPGVKAMPCPKCGSLFYPEGSGQCWKCEKRIC
jgi:hypothetical protein